MDELQTLRDKANAYVKEKADKIVAFMVKYNELSTTESTCDCPLYGWDVEYHRMFPRIADELRSRGFNVYSQVNHGVTDWRISINP